MLIVDSQGHQGLVQSFGEDKEGQGEGQPLGQASRSFSLTLPLTGCMNLCKWLGLSELQFTHMLMASHGWYGGFSGIE